MAAIENATPELMTSSSAGSPANVEAVKEVSIDSIMERLRSKASHYKSWGEMSKALRLSVVEKRNTMDIPERSCMQKVLDTLQKSIKVTSLQSMVERLDSICRQQGLKFSIENSTLCFISSEAFYVEILLEPSGEVSPDKGVKMSLTPDGKGLVVCPELIKVLRSGNFTEFTKHLEGFASIYQLNASIQEKGKAYSALEALETDLCTLAQIQSTINEPSNLVHKSPVGILQKRRGGFPMKLTYFISPYDLLDIESKTSIPLTIDAVIEKGLGHSVTVCIESSTAHKLQIVPTITKDPKKENLPSCAAYSMLNSAILPAIFILKLPEPIPVANSILKAIQKIQENSRDTKISGGPDLSNSQSLVSVIINNMSKGKLQNSDRKGLYVTLPDQHHCYNMKSNSDLQGVLVSVIPFTHPTSVPQILVFLRQQMLFNTVISSCVRPASKKDVESALKFDIHAYSTTHIQVTFVHPLDESLAAVDLDLTDITSVKCKIYTLGINNDSLCTDEYASKVMQRCLSIPVTMRAIIRKAQWQHQRMKPSNQSDMYVSVGGGVQYLSHLPNYGNGLTNGSSAFSGDFSNLASRMCNKPVDEAEMSNVPLNSNKADIENQNCVPSDLLTDQRGASPCMVVEKQSVATAATAAYADRSLPIAKNPLLGTLLAQGGTTASTQIQQFQHSKHPNTMLMSMLSDVPSGKPFPSLGQNEGSVKVKKQRKRKAPDARSPGSMGRSPKRKLSEDDRDQAMPDADSTNSPSVSFDVNCTMPSMSSSSMDQVPHIGRSSTPLCIKSEPQAQHNYPQRSASTDSYLMHNFHPKQAVNLNDSNRLSEGGTPNLTELFINQGSLAKNPCSYVDDVLDFHQGTHCQNDTSVYLDNPGNISDMDLDDEGSFGFEANQKRPPPQKLAPEKPVKKAKKNKEGNEHKKQIKEHVMTKPQDMGSSEESSSGDFLQKSSSEAENSQSEDLSIITKSHGSHPLVISRSLKIAKSGNSHKISKSEVKSKQRDGRKSTSAGDEAESSSGKRKSESKKERKRKRAESADGLSGQSPARLFQPSVDSSLMPPPSSSSSSDSSPALSASDAPPIRPITLNMKASPTSSSMSSPSRSKSPLPNKKSSSVVISNSPSKSTSIKSNSDRIVKPSPPRPLHSSISKSLNPDGENQHARAGKVSSALMPKPSSKHKQSSSSKSSSGHSLQHTTGRSSPSKPKSATLKLKPLVQNLSTSSSLVSSMISKTANASSALVPPVTSISMVSLLDPGSPPGKQGSNNKSNKSALRSRKHSLNAVIDKLKLTATNSQHPFLPGAEHQFRLDACGNPQFPIERKDSKMERKESSKEQKDPSKGSEGKSKYSVSDQFTVKQSSQGIKLTVTKTRSSDGSSKSSKNKNQSSKTSVSSSGSSNRTLSSSGTKVVNIKKSGGNLTSHSGGSAISKVSSVTVTSINLTTSTVSSSGVTSSMQPKNLSSSSSSKPSTKTISSTSSQNKSNLLTGKPPTKAEKKAITESPVISTDMKDKLLPNLPLHTMPLPPPNKLASGEITRSITCTTIPKRTEEPILQPSPKSTPTCESYMEESDGEKAFRLLLEQSKPDLENCSEPNTPISKASDFSSVPLNFSTMATLPNLELEERTHWVSSSTDVKTAPWVVNTTTKTVQDMSVSAVDLVTNAYTTKPIAHTEVSSSNKLDIVNTSIHNSMDDIGKMAIPFAKPNKQPKRLNAHSEDDSSPEDRLLIIDYSDNSRLSAKSPNKKWSSPLMESSATVVFSVSDDKSDKSDLSPGTFLAKTPYQPSPSKSPAQIFTSPSNHSSSRPSPVTIDDELMNEALMSVSK